MSKHRSTAAGAALAWLFASALCAQDYRARVQGVVTDATQAAVAGATVTLQDTATGVRVTRSTDALGHYLFDYVEPGSYTLTIALAGFNTLVQENVRVQSRGDVTVNGALTLGPVQETVTVRESPVAVQFNTSSLNFVVDTNMANGLPRFDRNPFKLAMLDPAVRNTNYGEMNPYYSFAANRIDLGGSTTGQNDLLVDGSPIGIGQKASYTPPMDSVQEVTILQNSVDAEFGHSAGGVVSMTMKSGTNETHGSLFYLGRNPALNAVTDRTNLTRDISRHNIWGGNGGFPIVKNKVFNFATYEQWRLSSPNTYIRTMPTDLERAGDFSQSLNINGGIRTIYDPWSTSFDANGKVKRTPFSGNRIPAARIDPVSRRVMDDLWGPNNPGDDITGINNFKAGVASRTKYWNFSDRADWYINDAWKVFGRFSRFRTFLLDDDPTPNGSPAYCPNGSARHALSVSGDAVYVLNERTVLNFHGDYHSFVDDFSAPQSQLGQNGLGEIWPNAPWYTPYDTGVPAFYPRMQISGSEFGQWRNYRYQHPDGASANAKVSRQWGRHYLKAGFDTRRYRGTSLSTTTSVFQFDPGLTADTFINPNTKLIGDGYATFLLGALDSTSQAVAPVLKEARTEFYAAFIQDDLKLTPWLTLNLGLRYEYESPWHDPAYRMSRFLDLNSPIPEMQANPPQIPEAAASLMEVPYVFNGAWVFSDESNPGIWNAQKLVLMPRLGVALRIDNRTALRVGFARYAVPTVSKGITVGQGADFFNSPYAGFEATQNVAPALEGVPQARFESPFPPSNPLIPPLGKGFGRYLELGESRLTWFNQNPRRGANDRVNVSFQRQMPNHVVLDVTYFANIGHDLPYVRFMNLMDPQLNYTYRSALSKKVPNPFYNYLTEEQFPGPLRNQEKVTIASLLVPYPQYGQMRIENTPGARNRFHSLEIRAQRGFSGGYNFLVGYSYNREWNDYFFSNDEQYLDLLTLEESERPRHRFNAAAVWELPFGKGRRYLSGSPEILDWVLGGWQTGATFYFNSGEYVRFGAMEAEGNPKISNPTPDRWFDTSKFSRQPAYTPRTNPKQYPGLTGPKYWVIDATLSKTFSITERIRAELKGAAYNLTNRLNWANPDTNVNRSTFGRVLRQRNSVGRQVELGLTVRF